MATRKKTEPTTEPTPKTPRAKKPAAPKKAADKPPPKKTATAKKPAAAKSPAKPRKTAAKSPQLLPTSVGVPPELSDGVALSDFQSLVHCACYEPHRLLGCHRGTDGTTAGLVVRAWHPDAREVHLVSPDIAQPVALKPLGIPGVFGAFLPNLDFPFSYKLRYSFANAKDWETADPYHFMPSIGALDVWLLGEGNHLKAYRKFGAQVRTIDGVKGVSFSVWAPAAKRISVIGEFNNWDGRLHPMRSMGGAGIWELFIPGVQPGMGYKFEILTQDGHLRYKADPYAFGFDLRPSTHSKVVDLTTYKWNDQFYMDRLSEYQPLDEAMNVYEVHLGSWMRVPEEGNRWLTYRELAERLVPHAKRYGFTHLELLPVAEHPFDGSWGYQVTGYYAPTSRFGTPDDFKFFVDYCHQNHIGVIVDWVPAHFPKDDFALRLFDGTPLYEHADPRRGEHKDWGTLIFDYGRPEVKNFLLSNALFWLDEYHIDGLRVDAVASMIYLDYSRKAGEWMPNKFGGNENLEAIGFLRQLNEVVHRDFPGRFTVAEESTAFRGVSRPTYDGGLGFTFKWNMGWMNDTLRYYMLDPIYRKYHQNDLTFSLIYQYTENFMLPLSHDEVVHGKGSLIQKMPGDQWQKFANLRLLYSYMYAHPGKKLLFQGAEFAQYKEWQCDRSLDWHLGGEKANRGIENCLASLGWTYRNNREFWKFDNDPIGFRWIDFSDADASVLVFMRVGPESHIVCIFNLTPIPRYGYRVGLPKGGNYREIFNSDAAEYGGSAVGNHGQVIAQSQAWHGQPFSGQVNVPPLGAVFIKPE